jgi:putative FmdB family regulatory protein
MPFYDYKCSACQECFEEFLPIKQRKKPETKPCPKCGEKRVHQVIISSPNVGVDFGMDIHKAKGGFKDAMQRVADAPGIKGSRRAKELKDKYNL